MKKWNLIIDVALCTDCNMCTLSCHDEYVDNDFPGYAAAMPKHGHRWIEINRKERGQVPMVEVAYLPVMCNHCDDAPCMKEAKDGAITKRPDGILLIDPVKSRGQKHLVDACPYGAIWWNAEKNIPQHWIFDAHLLDDGWKETRGAQVCPTGSMKSLCVEDAEMQRLAAEEGLETLRPELGTQPRVYYKNLDRYTKAFIGGSVVAKADGRTDCVEGASVTLKRDSETISEATTDNYGDFKFDG
ncbi:MAG: oxidoreductase, partial [Rhodospirillales bacterium]|nr:oxidoreductase [Rhodospirillales bacterium]